MTWPTKNLLKLMVWFFLMSPSTLRSLLTDIQESWKHFDKEYCFKLVKSVPERIKTDIKTRGGGTTKYWL